MKNKQACGIYLSLFVFLCNKKQKKNHTRKKYKREREGGEKGKAKKMKKDRNKTFSSYNSGFEATLAVDQGCIFFPEMNRTCKIKHEEKREERREKRR